MVELPDAGAGTGSELFESGVPVGGVDWTGVVPEAIAATVLEAG